MKQPIRLLYFDNSREGQELVRDALRKGPDQYELIEIESPCALENSLAEGGYELVLAGLQTGLVEALHAQNDRLAVIILADAASERRASEAVEAGATDYVIKTPQGIQRLPFAIRLALQRRMWAHKQRVALTELRRLNHDLERQIAESTDKVAAAEKEVEALSYSVSHDLRAPIRAIEGFSRILVEDYTAQLDLEGQRYLNLIVSSAEQLTHLLDALLSFSRLSRATVEKVMLDMARLARSVATELSHSSPEPHVEITVHEIPPAFGDTALIRQVLVHLLTNAYKFTRRQLKPRVEVFSYREGKDIIYAIKDNGIGFDAQYAHKLFGVFQRLHRPADFEGVGMGLAMVKRLVHLHGGRVWAEGKVNGGATFFFSLPEKIEVPGNRPVF